MIKEEPALKCSCPNLPCQIHGDKQFDIKSTPQKVNMKKVCLCDCGCKTCKYTKFVTYLEQDLPIRIFYFDSNGIRKELTLIKTI